MSSKIADPIGDLVAHVGHCQYEDLPTAAITAAKAFLVDTLGNGIAGTSAPESKRVLAGAGAEMDSGAQVWGRNARLPAQAAALVNSYQIHCLEYDCVHEGAVLHPMTPLVAAVMADVQQLGRINGRDLITALIVGVDVSCNIALASTVASPFFRTGSVTALGVAAACARLRGLPTDMTHHALGITFEAMGSSRQAHTEGTSIMGLLAGFAARNGLLGCDLAEQGIQGPSDILAGPYGYWNLYEGSYEHEEIWEDIGNIYRITELAQKPYPSGRPTHLGVDATIALMMEHDITIADVDSAVCAMPMTVTRLVGRPLVADATPNYARLCTAYCVASTLSSGNLSQADFSPDALRRQDVCELANNIDIIADRNPDPNAIGPATLTVTLKNGSRLEKTIEFALGHPKNPMTEAQKQDKFWSCWSLADSSIDKQQGSDLLDRIDRLETSEDISDLPTLMNPVKR
jgi:aconitate decarboxylase